MSNDSVKHEYTVLLSKPFIFQAIQFSQTVLIRTIQFSVCIVFVHAQLNVKKVSFQTIEFSACTFSMLKTVLFQVIQFCISTQFSFICSIGRALSGATAPDDRGPEAMAMAIKGYSAFPKTPALLELHYQII